MRCAAGGQRSSSPGRGTLVWLRRVQRLPPAWPGHPPQPSTDSVKVDPGRAGRHLRPPQMRGLDEAGRDRKGGVSPEVSLDHSSERLRLHTCAHVGLPGQWLHTRALSRGFPHPPKFNHPCYKGPECLNHPKCDPPHLQFEAMGFDGDDLQNRQVDHQHLRFALDKTSSFYIPVSAF